MAGPAVFSVFEIEPPDPDGAVSVIKRRTGGRGIVHQPRRAVIVDEQRRIDAADIFDPHRIGPGPCGILGGDDEIAAAIDAGVDDIEDALVMGDGGREHAARQTQPVEIQLAWPVDGIADLGPVHQVAAAEHRQAGEIGEGGGDEIIVAAHPRQAGIGIEPGQHRIAIFRGPGGKVEGRVVAGIFEPVEPRGFAVPAPCPGSPPATPATTRPGRGCITPHFGGGLTNAATSRAASVSMPALFRKPRSRNQSVKRIGQVPSAVPSR